MQVVLIRATSIEGNVVYYTTSSAVNITQRHITCNIVLLAVTWYALKLTWHTDAKSYQQLGEKGNGKTRHYLVF